MLGITNQVQFQLFPESRKGFSFPNIPLFLNLVYSVNINRDVMFDNVKVAYLSALFNKDR